MQITQQNGYYVQMRLQFQSNWEQTFVNSQAGRWLICINVFTVIDGCDCAPRQRGATNEIVAQFPEIK